MSVKIESIEEKVRDIDSFSAFNYIFIGGLLKT